MSVEGLEVTALDCQRGGHIVVPGLSFTVRSGSALILRGPNGSGKTTLLRTLAGFLPAAAGSVNVQGGAASDAVFHYLGHANGVKPRLSVYENVLFWQRYYGTRHDPKLAEDALEAFGLLHLAEFRAAHLSQGQARRLGLSRLLAAHRPVWLLDEPSVSLDAASTVLLERAIARQLEDGGIVLVSTHLDLALPRATILTLGDAAVIQ